MKHSFKTYLLKLFPLPLYGFLFLVLFLLATQRPVYAASCLLGICGDVLDQNGQEYVGATVTMTWTIDTFTRQTTSTGYDFAPPCGLNGNPFTVTLTVPSGYTATSATSWSGTTGVDTFMSFAGNGCNEYKPGFYHPAE